LIPGERFNKTIAEYLLFANDFNAKFPGFETFIHGLGHVVDDDGRDFFYVDCLKLDE